MGNLTYYNLLRVSRQRGTSILLLGLPLAAGLLQGAIHEVRVWWCVALCAAVTGAVVWLFSLSDRKSGLAAAVTSCRVSASEIMWSRLLTAVVIYTVELAVFAGARAVWPGGGS